MELDNGPEVTQRFAMCGNALMADHVKERLVIVLNLIYREVYR